MTLPAAALPACQESVAEVSVTLTAESSEGAVGAGCMVLSTSGAVGALSAPSVSTAVTVIE